MTYKTNYHDIHENQYKRLKANNEAGWMDIEYKTNQFKRLKALINKYIGQEKLNILELGCGDAELSIMLGKEGHSVAGVDISPTAIEWAKEKASKYSLKADFRCSSVTDIEFEDSSFDVILDSACLHCIIGEDRKLLFGQVKRLLKPNGIFIGETMCNFIPEYFREFANEEGLIIKNGFAGRYIGKSEKILTEIRRAGFEEVYSVVNPRKDDEESDDLLYIFETK